MSILPTFTHTVKFIVTSTHPFNIYFLIEVEMCFLFTNCINTVQPFLGGLRGLKKPKYCLEAAINSEEWSANFVILVLNSHLLLPFVAVHLIQLFIKEQLMSTFHYGIFEYNFDLKLNNVSLTG